MAIITRISPSKRRPNWHQVYLDNTFAFSCKTNVVARFKLRPGIELDASEVDTIKRGEIEQECRDAALEFLSRRLHSQAELRRKLLRKEYDPETVETALQDMVRLGYLDDRRFAATKTLSAIQHKQHGKRRAYLELLKSGVTSELANQAVNEVYDQTDSAGIARRLAMKKAPSLRKLEPAVARRRLAAHLLRRGFEYEAIKGIIDEILGADGIEQEIDN